MDIKAWILSNCKFAQSRKKFEDNPVINPAQPVPPAPPGGAMQPINTRPAPIPAPSARPQAPIPATRRQVPLQPPTGVKPQGFIPMNDNKGRAKAFEDIQQNVQPTQPALIPQPQQKQTVPDPFDAFRQKKLDERSKPINPINTRNKP